MTELAKPLMKNQYGRYLMSLVNETENDTYNPFE